MLGRKKVSVKEVALSLGYQNGSKFSKSFKKTFGKLPSGTLSTFAAVLSAIIIFFIAAGISNPKLDSKKGESIPLEKNLLIR
jgi:AraC-like DNA-binding protein